MGRTWSHLGWESNTKYTVESAKLDGGKAEVGVGNPRAPKLSSVWQDTSFQTARKFFALEILPCIVYCDSLWFARLQYYVWSWSNCPGALCCRLQTSQTSQSRNTGQDPVPVWARHSTCGVRCQDRKNRSNEIWECPSFCICCQSNHSSW